MTSSENMKLSRFELERIVLEVIQRNPSVAFATDGVHEATLTYHVRERLPEDQTLSNIQVAELIWSLLSQGLVFVDFNNQYAVHWRLNVTERGSLSLQDQSNNPDDASNYIKNIKEITDNDKNLMVYADEALHTYRAQCYLSTIVMLGVASESAFYQLGDAFLNWLAEGNEKENFSKILHNKKLRYIQKFTEFRKRLAAHIRNIDEELTDNLTLTLDAVLELLRINRNEAGHPTGKIVNRHDAFVMLQIFPHYLKRLFQLKDFFVQNSTGIAPLSGEEL